jgi:hypothetical protein
MLDWRQTSESVMLVRALGFVVGFGLSAACGKVQSSEGGPPSDAYAVDASLLSCDLTKPFGPPTLIGFGGGDKGEVWLSEDELTAYVTAFGSTYTIFSTTRNSLTSPFGSLIPTEINAGTADGHRGTVSADGLTMILYSYRTPSLGKPRPLHRDAIAIGGGLSDTEFRCERQWRCF